MQLKRFKDILDDILFWLRFNVLYPYKDIKYGLNNYWKYRKIIWRDRWYDHDFILDLIQFKLDDMEKHWGVDTHYVGDHFTKLRIQSLQKDLQKYRDLINGDLYFPKKYYKQEEKQIKEKISRRFFRLLPKFWD
jgi:hypothetical protein